MRLFYSICALLALALSAPSARAQGEPSESRSYTVFLRGTPIGREDVTVAVSAGGIVISAQGRLSPPLDVITRRAEVRYGPDWRPELLTIKARVRGGDVSLKTTFSEGEAVTEATEKGAPLSDVDPVSPRTIVLPNLFFGAYEALARRLVDAQAGETLPGYIAPQSEIPVTLRSVNSERIQTGATTFNVRRYELTFASPGGDVAVQLSADEQGRLVRLTIPSQALDVVRDDVAASTARTQTHANPGDEAVTIPGAGFNIAGTITKPAEAAVRYPAVVLLSGSGVGDRDGVAAGVPIAGQLAGALAEAGFLAVRYDKRGYGQTGGRTESATLSDFAEDARAVVRYLSDRKDVDRDRIALVGHSEGAWVAMMAAARERRIGALVMIAAPAVTGAEAVLEQQRQALDQMQISEAERQAKIDLQQKIHSAVMTGKGWDEVPPELRKQADTPWFQSLLAFDPAREIRNVRQPILILHGELDRQVPVSHADRLGELARSRSRSRAIEVITVRGVNHLLVPATTGEVSEYGSLPDRNVSAELVDVLIGWLENASRVR